ncbi:hypothetical protein [Paraburkholderia sediminicola]|uniref:hypothetical protein n=1 Tax=Paraburkholderia sediminicola TaxID=458836 RepID=UPI0038B98849
MTERRLLNVSRLRQQELRSQFSWLRGVHVDEKNQDVQVNSVSTFDHWLSWEEACKILENVPPVEEARRNSLLADFCTNMIAETDVLSFALRGRQKNTIIFRNFTSKAALANYCRPCSGKILGHRHFFVVLPVLDCAFYESWDNTYHFFFTKPGIADAALDWAKQSNVYLLAHK